MKRYIVILNPIAGKGHAEKRIPEIEAFFFQHKLEYEIVLTEHPGHAIKLAESYAQMEDVIIVAAGGDGTINEIINGLMHASEKIKDRIPAFGVLAIGRGNDFAFSANIPVGLSEDLLRIKNGKPVPMDVGEVKGGDYPDGRYFGNGLGIGFDTLVGLEAAKMNNVHGSAAYALGAIKTLIKYPAAPDLDIYYGKKTVSISPALVSVMNGRRLGGSFFMAPKGKMNDGLFDICMTKQGKRRELLSAMIAYTKGTQGERGDTITGRTEKITVEALSGTLAVHADGETICKAGKRLEIINHKHALMIIE
ncbi:MAG: YegS/Rv2252/BmrU family lipid kinase [Candidatus Marinimicrobia bacterium]|nr:YegS/Rv2252/BmrU family lipid kinase [Candidatus Neomarinimicrobiota bacterium]